VEEEEMKLALLIISLAVGLFAMSNDTTTVRYGVSLEPLTSSDTVTVRHYHKTNDGYYLLPLAGGEIWAAWIQIKRKEVSCVK
jgi:hypothetical protein